MVKRILGKKTIGFFLFCTIFPVNLFTQNLLNGPNDIVFDEANNRYLVANWAGNSIVAIDSNGHQQLFRNNVIHAHGMEIRDSVLFIASYHNLVLINLSSAEIIASINVPNSQNLGHITLDSSHFVYMTDWSSQRLFRIDVNNQTSTSLRSFSTIPVGVCFEEENNRLIILTLVHNAPILGYNISTGNLFTIINTSINDPDAICQDADGNYYITSFSDNVVCRFRNDFLTGPEIISSGHDGPSGIGYNRKDNTIAVTNYNSNRIDFIQLESTNVEYEQDIKPAVYMLFQNYPNPFNPSTSITYLISKSDFVSLTIYDMLGREIQTLVKEIQEQGTYTVNFNSDVLSSGIYFYRLHVGNDFVETKKMMFLR
jgi:sugar lactone lactonase YvrE